MPRQKLPRNELQHKDVQYQDKSQLEHDEDNQLTQSEPEPDSDQSSEEDPYPELSYEECYVQGTTASDIDTTIKCFEVAVRKFADEIDDETAPELGKYWLAYGDALLKREEDSSDIFAAKSKNEDDDDRQVAWECLDVARVCFHKYLENLEAEQKLQRTHPVSQTSAYDFMKKVVADRTQWPITTSWQPGVQKIVNDAIFTSLRLGDFCQNHHRYPEACTDFLSGLVLSIRYGSQISEALSTAIPLAHCLMAQDHELTEIAFEFGLILMEWEIASPNISQTRKELLTDTHVDFKLQLDEYVQQMEILRESAHQAFSTILPIPDDDSSVQDLGTIGKSRKKN